MALTQVTSIGLKDGEIVNADLHSAAAIALSKLADTGALGSAITATTQSASDDTTKLATTAFVQAAVTSLIDGAPGSLNTLNELAAAINDDSSYATTLTTALATKAVLTGSTNNTIATVTGANALVGEANLTWDGTTLDVTGNYSVKNPSDASYITHTFSSNFAKIDVRGTDIANSKHYLIGYGAGHGSANDLHLVNSVGDLVFRTSTERLRIKSDGNIIPGTNNATSIGDGSTNFNSIWASTRFRGNDNVKLVLGNSQNLVIRYDGSNNIIGSPVANDLHIKSGTGDNDNQLIATFKHSNASVGIGTNSPDQLLHLAAASNGPFIRLENTDTSISANQTFGGIEFESKDGSTGSAGVISKIDCISTATFDGSSIVGGEIRFHTSTTNSISLQERLRIKAGGDVLIAASGADQKRSIRIDGTNGSSEIQGVVLESDGENALFHIKAAAGGGTPSNRLTINAISGNVGIGGIAPNYQLHCTSTIGVGGHGLNNQQLTIGNNAIQSLNLGVGYTALALNASGGNVGIGIAAPIKKLDIATSASADGIRIKSTGSTYNDINLDANRSAANTHIGRIISHWNGTAISYISFDTGDAAASGKDKGYMRFWTANGSGNFERLRIHSAGDVEVKTGNLKIGTAGKGIMFHPYDETATANGSDSNLLDDYEEGHFQPSISSSSRTGTITYSNRVGLYTKIGNRVFAQIYLNIGGGTNTTNTFLVTGLPFTCISTASHEGGGYHTYMGAFFTVSADRQNTPWVTLGTSSVRFYKTSDGGSLKGNETSTSSNYLIFHVQYVVA